ncbi:hypothetical protein HDV00_000519, partial [Rhizophlyctis rosea]
MTQTQLFKLAKQLKKDNPLFNPIPASRLLKRPIGKWAGNSYIFEKEFPKREQPNCNLGLLVTEEYVVVDVDAKPPADKAKVKVYSKNNGTDDWKTLMERNGGLPATLQSNTWVEVTTPTT